MIKKSITKVIEDFVYIAEDGTEFKSKYECENYEKNIALYKKWGAKNASIITDEYTWSFYYILSRDELVSFIDYLTIVEKVRVSRKEYSEIIRNAEKYIGGWITYKYDDYGDAPSFYIYTLKEREDMANETLSLITDEINFYAILKEHAPNNN